MSGPINLTFAVANFLVTLGFGLVFFSTGSNIAFAFCLAFGFGPWVFHWLKRLV